MNGRLVRQTLSFSKPVQALEDARRERARPIGRHDPANKYHRAEIKQN
jgi:hypothetical protein